MANPVNLLVLSVPGLSARMLANHAAALPAISALARAGTAATITVIEGATPQQLERALFTGALPELSHAQPFWRQARIPALIAPEFQLPRGWIANDPAPRLRLLTFDGLSDNLLTGLRKLETLLEAHPMGALVVMSAWCEPGPTPLDRPVLITRGIEQDKTCVGILEIAGILQRALTGQRVTDAN